MSESRLTAAWRDLRARRRIALIPYLTAGYPSPAEGLDALRTADRWADIIEVGVPFSDPLADGPTIQRSTFEALRQGMTLQRTLDLVAEARLEKPVVLFSYLNPILHYGLERLLAAARDIGVAGLLLTDLPAGADPAMERVVRASPLDLIRLVAPTTAADRVAAAVAGAEGFIYVVARLGVTGARDTLPPDLTDTVSRVRAATTLPVAVGFGISNPEQARVVAGLADGVVVGSALIDILARDGVPGADRFLRHLREALDAAEVVHGD
ncbi:MAG: tryptophan synthase subunit alpha [Gemmatimonadota bacterium]